MSLASKELLKEQAKILKDKLELKEGDYWFDNRKEILERILTDDIDNFLNWKVIRETMNVVGSRVVKEEFDALDLSYWSPIIKESKVGNPIPAPYYSESSENLIHHAYHIDTFQKRFNKKIVDMNSIVEFGGGYGSMCRLIRNMGFKGEYIIFDFPEVNLLQSYFLYELGLTYGTIITDEESVFDSPHDLLIATWSLSEIPMDSNPCHSSICL